MGLRHQGFYLGSKKLKISISNNAIDFTNQNHEKLTLSKIEMHEWFQNFFYSNAKKIYELSLEYLLLLISNAIKGPNYYVSLCYR